MLEPRSTPDPLVALVIFLVAMALLAALFWPRRGFLSRVVRLFRLTERVRLEDALKQLYHATVGGRSATVETLAGSLEVRRGVAVRLVERLTELGLARAENGRLTLTPAGQTYALRMVRTHRLWERYLADRSGLSPAEWHEEAERQDFAPDSPRGNAICRMVDASEIAFVTVFLASEKAWAVSGELVAATGGAGRAVYF